MCVLAQKTAPGKSGGREMSCHFRLDRFKVPVAVAQTQVQQTTEVQSLSFFWATFCVCVCVCVCIAHINSNSSHGQTVSNKEHHKFTSHALCQYKKA